MAELPRECRAEPKLAFDGAPTGSILSAACCTRPETLTPEGGRRRDHRGREMLSRLPRQAGARLDTEESEGSVLGSAPIYEFPNARRLFRRLFISGAENITLSREIVIITDRSIRGKPPGIDGRPDRSQSSSRPKCGLRAPLVGEHRCPGAAQAGIDAEQRETADKLQKLIVEELHHRIKNTLATVSAIASQSLRTATDLEHGQQAIESRLLALGRAHDLLLQARWSSTSLAHIVQGATEPYDSKREGRISIQGADPQLCPAR
jgi:hypothetical protein